MNAIRILENAAIRAHARGDRWADFWERHAEAVRQAEPVNAGRYRRLVNRLLSLVASGDTNGMVAVGDDDMPWEIDDAHKPADVGTAARIDWTAAGSVEVSP
jgi:hypothetical protein